MAEIRVSQSPVQVLLEATNPDIEISQAPVQVLVTSANPELEVTQAPVQILVKAEVIGNLVISVAGNNHPICNINGLVSGTYDYVVLSGADVSTATFLQAGTVSLSSGEGIIDVTGLSSGDPVILVLQLNDTIGAYEAEIF